MCQGWGMLPEWGTLPVGVRGHWQTWEQGSISRLGDITKEGSEGGETWTNWGTLPGACGRDKHSEMETMPVGHG